ncbi:MAG TPA: DUF58 domain-containing protein [Gallionellaceae bacterium]|nr:DUF58 domain-containing protein [Gallionellaceae bacterium]
MMPVPHRNLLIMACAWLGLGIAVLFAGKVLVPWWQGFGLVGFAVAAADIFAGRRQRGMLEIVRELPQALAVGAKQEIAFRISCRENCDGRISGWLYDRHPPEFRAEGLPLAFEATPGRWVRTAYRLHVRERGWYRFEGVDLRLRSPFGLWLIPEKLALQSEVRVYPDFTTIAHYTLLATDNRLSQIGLLRRPRRGLGLEFHQLRDYRQDDMLRQIDWKASARAHRLISREYQDERDQQVVFLMDCGERMRAKDDDLSHFDHTLNALLLLGYVALRQGDAVGLCTFGHDNPRFVAPRKSVASVNMLLNSVYDLQPSLQTPDYLVASQYLSQRLTRRALVVLVTNIRDEDDDTLAPAMRHLRKSHAVTVASLREPVLETLETAPLNDFDDALTHAAALEYVNDRRRQVAALRHNGIQVLDTRLKDLPIALINHYWERKRAGVS